jgi:hypothetical protein
MKNQNTLILLAIGLGGIVLLATIADALALHDIGADYVSPAMVDAYELDPDGLLPGWSSTPMEWMVVNLSFLVRLVFTILNLVILVACLRLVERQRSAQKISV